MTWMKLAAITLVTLIVASAHAATYHVNGSTAPKVAGSMKAKIVGGQMVLVQPRYYTPLPPPPGDDSNPGTYDAPFRTITKASSVEAPGDQILIYAHEYVENVTNVAPSVTYQIASGVPEATKWSSLRVATNGVLLDGRSAAVITGSNLVSSTVHGGLNGSITFGPGASNVTIRNLAVNCKVQPPGTGIFNPCISVQVPNSNYSLIKDITLSGIVATNTGYHAMVLKGDRFLVTNCYFSSTQGWDAIRALTINSKYSTLTFSNWANPSNNPNHTDEIQAFSDNGEYSTNNVFERIFSIDGENCKIGNWADNTNFHNVHNNYYVNSIWIRTEGLCDISAPGISFYNCTLFYTGQDGGQPLSWTVVNDEAHGDGSGGRVYNCIFYACGLNPGTNGFNANGLGWSAPTNGQPGSVSGTSAGGFFSDWNWSIGFSNAAKRAYASAPLGFRTPLYNPPQTNDLNGINGGDPKFNNSVSYSNTWPGGGAIYLPSQLALQAGSAGLNAGTNLSTITTVDFFGNPRPGSGAWTIGAIQ